MKMRTAILTILTASALLVMGTEVWAGSKGGNRQRRQEQRILNGVRSGEITNREYHQLNRQQWKIQETRRRALRDGRITRHERKRLRHMLNRADDRIYRARHNAPTAYRRPPACKKAGHRPPGHGGRYRQKHTGCDSGDCLATGNHRQDGYFSLSLGGIW